MVMPEILEKRTTEPFKVGRCASLRGPSSLFLFFYPRRGPLPLTPFERGGREAEALPGKRKGGGKGGPEGQSRTIPSMTTL
jgi:hypothetical protein